MMKGGNEDLCYVDMTSQKEKCVSARRNQFNVCIIQNINTDRTLNCIRRCICR